MQGLIFVPKEIVRHIYRTQVSLDLVDWRVCYESFMSQKWHSISQRKYYDELGWEEACVVILTLFNCDHVFAVGEKITLVIPFTSPEGKCTLEWYVSEEDLSVLQGRESDQMRDESKRKIKRLLKELETEVTKL